MSTSALVRGRESIERSDRASSKCWGDFRSQNSINFRGNSLEAAYSCAGSGAVAFAGGETSVAGVKCLAREPFV